MKHKRYILRIVLAIVISLSLVVPSFAAASITYSTNGAGGKYGAGSELTLVGKVQDGNTIIKDAEVTVKILAGSTEIHFAKVVTDSQGYFRTSISVPKSVTGKLSVEISAAGVNEKNEIVLNASDKLDLLGFVGPAGYKEGGTVIKIPAGTSTLGFAFESNVNYYNNRNANLGLDSLGSNERNRDCFTLYKKDANGTFVYVGSSVDLVKSSAQGDTVISKDKITLLPGKTVEGGGIQGANLSRKDVIYMIPSTPLEANGEYKVVIDGRLSANHSGTMGTDETVYFSVAGSTGNTGTGSGGTTAPPENNTKVEVTTEIKGEKAETKITDAQITEALKNTSKDGTNNLVFEVKDNEISGKDVSELSLGLTGEQAKQLVGKAANVVYSTPMGEIKLPVSAFEGTSGNVSLTIAVDKDSPDTYIVTLSDSKGKITTFKDAVTLKFSAKDKNAGYNVLAHDGKIMKNAKVIDGVATGKTKGFSSFAFTSNKRTFPDIQNHWAKGNIESLASRNMIDGKSENSFDPDAGVTRAEFIKMIVNSVDNLNAKAAGTVTFTDIPQGKWYSDCVLWAAENKIVNGIGNGNFGPNQKITRQDMCVIIEKASESLGIKLYDEKAQSTFVDDDKIADYAKQSVYKMQKAGIVSGKGNNAFEPKSGATRAEASKIIDLLIDKLIYQ